MQCCQESYYCIPQDDYHFTNQVNIPSKPQVQRTNVYKRNGLQDQEINCCGNIVYYNISDPCERRRGPPPCYRSASKFSSGSNHCTYLRVSPFKTLSELYPEPKPWPGLDVIRSKLTGKKHSCASIPSATLEPNPPPPSEITTQTSK